MNNRNRGTNPGNLYDRTSTPQSIPSQQGYPQRSAGFVPPGGAPQGRYQQHSAAQSPRQSYNQYGGSPMDSNSRSYQQGMPVGGLNSNAPPTYYHHPSISPRPPQQLSHQHYGAANKFYPNSSGGSFPTMTPPIPSHTQYMMSYMPPNPLQSPRYVTPSASTQPGHHAAAPQYYPPGPAYQPVQTMPYPSQTYEIRQPQPNTNLQHSPAFQQTPNPPASTSQVSSKSRIPVVIRHPTTNEDITKAIKDTAKQDPTSGRGNSSNSNNKTISKTDPQVAATFATQVAQAAASPSTTSSPSLEAQVNEPTSNQQQQKQAAVVAAAPKAAVAAATSSDPVASTDAPSSAVEVVVEKPKDAAPVVESAAVEKSEDAAVEALTDGAEKMSLSEKAVVEEKVVEEEEAPEAEKPVVDVAGGEASGEKVVDVKQEDKETAVEAPVKVEEAPVVDAEQQEVAQEESQQEVEKEEARTAEPVQVPSPAPVAAEEKVEGEEEEEKPAAVSEEPAKPVEAPVSNASSERNTFIPHYRIEANKKEEEKAAQAAAQVQEAAEKEPEVKKENGLAEGAAASEEPAEETAEETAEGGNDVADENDESELEEGEIVDSDDDDSKTFYERDFLLSLRGHPLSMVRPNGLEQNIPSEIVVHKPNNSNHLSNNGGMFRDNGPPDFTPNFVRDHRDHHDNNRGRHPRDRDHRRPVRGPYNSNHGNQNKHVYKRPEAELSKTKNAWKPSKQQARNKDPNDEKAKTEEVYRQVRSILNKLTPENFPALMQRIQTLPINTVERLRGVIELIFEKAIDEPNFSEAYANMCSFMSTKQVKASDGEQKYEFRKLLITRCQLEFEKDVAEEQAIKKIQERIANADTPENKKKIEDELQMAFKKQRSRMLGNIRFIGELYKLRMLTENIMHSCIKSLLNKKTEESLESLCRLLTTIGAQLSSDSRNKQKDQRESNTSLMKQYFDGLQKIVAGKTTSSRVRFMIQDVVDLRKRNWQLRASQTTGPKTIEEIHADHKNEKEQANLRAAAMATSGPKNMRSGGGGGGRHGSRNNQHSNQGGDDASGWHTVTSQKPNRFDPKKMRNITSSQNLNSQSSQFDVDSITFAPRGMRSNPWTGRSNSNSGPTRTGSGGYSSSVSSQRGGNRRDDPMRSSTPNSNINRFSALQNQQSMQQQQEPSSHQQQRDQPSRMNSGGSSSSNNRNALRPATTQWNRFSALADQRQDEAEVSRNMGRDGYRHSRDSGPTASMPNSKRDLLDTTRRMTAYHSGKSESSASAAAAKAAEKPPVPKMSAQELKLKHEGIVKEFLHLQSVKEASECYAELNQYDSGDKFIETAMLFVLDRSEKDNAALGPLFCKMIEAKDLTSDQFMKGAKLVAAECIDLEVDIPKVFSAFAKLIAPTVANAGLTLVHLKEIAAEALLVEGDYREDKRLKLAVPVLVEMREIMGMENLKAQWSKWVDWSCFSDDKAEVERMRKQHDLQELEDSAAESLARGDGEAVHTQQTQYVKQLLEVTEARKNFAPEEAFGKIDRLYGPEVTNSNDFVRAVSITYVWRSLSRQSDKDYCPEDMYLMERLTEGAESGNPDVWKLDTDWFTKNVLFFQKYVDGQDKELQALYALQHLFLRLGGPMKLLKTLFDQLYDAEVISEESFYNWEKSEDPTESEGKGVALNSARSFFMWLKMDNESEMTTT